jgi:GH18 family chitinase
MVKVLAACAWILLAGRVSDAAVANDSEPATPPFRVAGYLPDYRFGGGGIDVNATAALVDDLYLFSLSPQPSLGDNMFALSPLRKEHFEEARQARASHPDTNLWVTIGGGGRSSNMLKKPAELVRAAALFVEREGLQGVDFDCEFFRTHDDYRAYEKMLVEAAQVLRGQGVQVSVALHAGQTMPAEVYWAVDRVNLMTYDMLRGGGGGEYHADMQQARGALDALIESGCPRRKIFFGLPAYGRHREAPAEREPRTYAELVDGMLEQGFGVEHLENLNAFNGYRVDSPDVVRQKVSYAHRENLGGVFFWELGQDKLHETAPGGILLKAAAETVKKLNEEKQGSSKKDTPQNDEL